MDFDSITIGKLSLKDLLIFCSLQQKFKFALSTTIRNDISKLFFLNNFIVYENNLKNNQVSINNYY